MRIAAAPVFDPDLPADRTDDDRPGCGEARTPERALPLVAIDIDASLSGLTASCRLRQRFTNPTNRPVEVTYVFPLPNRGAVTAMTATLGGRRVEGRLLERGQARQTYEDALVAGQRASLAEKDRPDVFTVTLGNLRAGEDADVELELVCPLEVDDGEATFRFPLVVAPRYSSGIPLDVDPAGAGVAGDTDAVPDASRVTPPRLRPDDPRPELACRVRIDDAGLGLTGWRSSLHALTVEDGAFRLEPGERLDRDLILRARLTRERLLTAAVVVPDQEGPEGTWMLSLIPPSVPDARSRDGTSSSCSTAPVPCRDGSWWPPAGPPPAWSTASTTVTGSPRPPSTTSLRARSRPSWRRRIGTGSPPWAGWRAWRRAAAPSSAGALERAADLFREGIAGRARSPGAHHRRAGLRRGRRRHGRVPPPGRRHRAQRRHRPGGQRRPARPPVPGQRRASRAGRERGPARRVPPPRLPGRQPPGPHRRRGDARRRRTNRWHLTPPVRDAVAGIPLVIAGRYRGDGSPGPITLALHAGGPGGDALPGRVVASLEDAPAVPVLWARDLIGDLEDRYACGERDPDLSQRIIGLSLRFGVLSRFTAFVAVDAERGQTDDVISITQPVEQPAGWRVTTGWAQSAGRVADGFSAAASPPIVPSMRPAARDASAAGGVPAAGGVRPTRASRGVARSPLSSPPDEDRLLAEVRRLLDRLAAGEPVAAVDVVNCRRRIVAVAHSSARALELKQLAFRPRRSLRCHRPGDGSHFRRRRCPRRA